MEHGFAGVVARFGYDAVYDDEESTVIRSKGGKFWSDGSGVDKAWSICLEPIIEVRLSESRTIG